MRSVRQRKNTPRHCRGVFFLLETKMNRVIMLPYRLPPKFLPIFLQKRGDRCRAGEIDARGSGLAQLQAVGDPVQAPVLEKTRACLTEGKGNAALYALLPDIHTGRGGRFPRTLRPQ